MKRYRIPILAIVAVFGALLCYFYGGGTVPPSQPALVRLDATNFAGLRQAFNSGGEHVRLIAMLSPT